MLCPLKFSSSLYEKSQIDEEMSQCEKEKCAWYLKNKIFSKILIAKKGKKRGEIEYMDFKEKHNKT